MEMRTVLLVPSEELGWETVRRALGDVPQAIVIGEATTLAAVGAAIPRLRPDLLLAATTLGSSCVAPLLRTLRGEGELAGRVALFADHLTHRQWDDLADLDLAGLLLWPTLTFPTLVACLVVLVAGAIRVQSPDAVSPVSGAGGMRGDPAGAVALTPRERAVLEGMAAGLTQGQIALAACVSERSVRRTVADLQERFAAASPFVLGARAAALGLVRVPIRPTPWPEPAGNLSGLSLVPPHPARQNGGTIIHMATHQ
jgi:DNA-binding NarL/FixJ family response regulator